MLLTLLLLQLFPGVGSQETIELGQIVQGRIDGAASPITTPVIERDYPPIPFRSVKLIFVAMETGPYYIDLRSRSFDAYIVVRDSNGNLLAEDDDSWYGTQSRAATALKAGETYSIFACAVMGGVGDFELSVRYGEPQPPSPGELAPWKRDPRFLASALRIRGLVHFLDWNRPREAQPLLERALKIAEENLGEQAQETAACLYALGRFFLRQHDYVQARGLLERAISVQESLLGREDFQTCDSFVELATILDRQGEYARSSELFEKAHAGFQKQVLEGRHRVRHEALRRCAEIAIRKGEWPEAERLVRQCVSLAEEIYRKDSVWAARELVRLGACLWFQGNSNEAKDCYRKALRIYEVAEKSARSEEFEARTRLAEILISEGNLGDARSLLEENLKKIDSGGEATRLHYAQSCEALGSLHLMEGDHEQARLIYERALSAFTKLFGKDNRFVVDANRSLARIEMESLQLDKARALLDAAAKSNDRDPRASYAIRSKIRILEDYGRLSFFEGNFEAAQRLLRESLDLGLAIPDAWRGDDVTAYRDLALLHLETGESAKAIEFARKAQDAIEANLHRVLGDLSEPERYHYVVAQREGLDIALHLAQQANDPEAAALAFDVLVSWKARIFQGMMSARQRVFQFRSKRNLAALEKLRNVQSQISTLFSSRDMEGIPIASQKMEELQRIRGELEKELQNKSAVSKTESVGWRELQKLLPSGSSFLNFIVHRPYVPAVRKEGRVVAKPSWGLPVLSAWILTKDGRNPELVSLGSAEEIEKLLQKFLNEIVAYRPVPGFANDALLAKWNREVLERIWAPIATWIRGDLVIVSADGSLGSLPFGVICQENGRYLLEDFRFVGLQEALGLAELQNPPAKIDGDLLVVGGVDFGASTGSSVKLRDHRVWAALSGTLEEGEEIVRHHEERFPKRARLLLHGLEPTEDRLKSALPKHAFLHFATHGFFNPDGLQSFWDDVQTESAHPWVSRPERREFFQGYMPGLLSGIVCAAANRPSKESGENGLLTAEEASWLDLSHCDLVVLSACQTGLGTVRGGEGVIGLRSAFRQAGAKTVISSLWSVGDRSTRDLMQKFYSALWKKKSGKLESLRSAQIELIEEQRKLYKNRAFPYAWGAFVLDGDWR